jgi:hypothetical protein
VASGKLGVNSAREYAALPLDEQADAYKRDLNKPSSPAAPASPPLAKDAVTPPTKTPSDNPVITDTVVHAENPAPNPTSEAAGDNPVITPPSDAVPNGVVPEPRTGLTTTTVKGRVQGPV